MMKETLHSFLYNFATNMPLQEGNKMQPSLSGIRTFLTPKIRCPKRCHNDFLKRYWGFLGVGSAPVTLFSQALLEQILQRACV